VLQSLTPGRTTCILPCPTDRGPSESECEGNTDNGSSWRLSTSRLVAPHGENCRSATEGCLLRTWYVLELSWRHGWRQMGRAELSAPPVRNAFLMFLTNINFAFASLPPVALHHGQSDGPRRQSSLPSWVSIFTFRARIPVSSHSKHSKSGRPCLNGSAACSHKPRASPKARV
jgi:hypothetical protein